MTVRDELEAAIAEVLAGRGEFVTKWLALVETVDEDGDRALWTTHDRDSTAWDRIGLLRYAEERQRAALNRDS